MENLDSLKSEVLDGIKASADLKTLDDIRVSVLGKKGRLLFKDLNNHTIRMIDDKSFGEMRKRLVRKAS